MILNTDARDFLNVMHDLLVLHGVPDDIVKRAGILALDPDKMISDDVHAIRRHVAEMVAKHKDRLVKVCQLQLKQLGKAGD